jgi:hypothetical protein
MCHLTGKINKTTFCIHGSFMILTVNYDYLLKNINQLIVVIVKCGVLFGVRSELLNIV